MLAQQRDLFTHDVGGTTLTAVTAGPEQPTDRPLIIALYGGTYTARYGDVAGSRHGSFLDVATTIGHRVVAFDRPGYGGSTPLDPAANTFERHAELLSAAITAVTADAGSREVFLVGHSIGGMIALLIAASRPDFPLIGVSTTGLRAVIPSGGAAEALGSLPPDVRVPVHCALAELGALWAGNPENVGAFAAMFTSAPFVSVTRGTGHSHALHLRQLAFAAECAAWARNGVESVR
ncbi:alpha/beta fold hydrolase [Amycolatopsis sp. CA-128772]|uniref:alpha/beta fold hydrolase n=1 Tax=Amycolatopsis sp. CA-128772 TaxID=2073159 RepID=UPI000CD05389|nr:alpha/beta fold hydrolase [Amycolatopsis sp. CA-128772]